MSSTPIYLDRILDTVTAHTGTGDYTLAGAITGFRAASTLGNAISGKFLVYSVDANGNPNGGWEEIVGTYLTSGTQLTRDKVNASTNAGAKVSWSSANLRVAGLGYSEVDAIPSMEMGGRLTLTSGSSAPKTDVTGATNVYYTLHRHNIVTLWNGNCWQRFRFSESGIGALPLGTLASATIPNDIFMYISAGAPAIEKLPWASISARATNIVQTQDGVWCKSGALDRRYIGTFTPTATTTTEDSEANRLLYNVDNQVARDLFKSVSSAHSYSGGIQSWNNDNTNRIGITLGLDEHDLIIIGSHNTTGGAGVYGIVGFGWDSTTAIYRGGLSNVEAAGLAPAQALPFAAIVKTTIGYHYAQVLEQGAGGSASTFNTYSISGIIMM